MTDQFITLKEAADILGIVEKEVRKLVDKGEITAYQIGGTYLRLKENQVLSLKPKYSRESTTPLNVNIKDTEIKGTFISNIKDFFYFNDFYLVSAGLIVFLLYVILKSIN